LINLVPLTKEMFSKPATSDMHRTLPDGSKKHCSHLLLQPNRDNSKPGVSASGILFITAKEPDPETTPAIHSNC
jgi:hypothetical protein